MPTLIQRVGPGLAEAIAHVLVNCKIHGPTPWVPTCTCVLEGTLAAEATHASVRCADHVRLAEDGDPAADDLIVEACLTCLTVRGIL